ncbi:protein kinase [Achlya hypogyna]|uniref:Protein kinase n=1 Tax=Achlya hypogyna TaxID=1202772 RepID=A0A1V9YM88_ACHHY|nr:protein kinase [Achlya hypogyna]
MRRTVLALASAAVVAAIPTPRECGDNLYLQQDIAESVNQWCVTCTDSPYECFPTHDTITLRVHSSKSIESSLVASDALEVAANVASFGALRDPATSPTGCHHLTILGDAAVATTVPFTSLQSLAHLSTLTLSQVTITPGAINTTSTDRPANLSSIALAQCTLPPKLELTAFEHLTSLSVTNSSLATFPSLAASSLRTLHTLDLRNNALTSFPTQVLHLTAPNVSINLLGNPLGPLTTLTVAERATYTALMQSGQLLVDAAVAATPSPTANNVAPAMVDPAPGKQPAASGSAFAWSTVLLIVVGVVALAGVVFFLVFRHRKAAAANHTLAASFLASDRVLSPFSAPALASPQIVASGPLPSLASYVRLEASEITRLKALPTTGLLSARFRGEPVLLKKLDVLAVQYDTQLERFLAQLERIALLSHPNVVALVGAVKLSGVAIAGVFPAAEKGSLAALVADASVALSWPLQLHMATGLAEGLLYLHEHTVEDATNWTSRDVVVHQDFICQWNTLAWLEDPTPPALLRFGGGVIAYAAPEVVLQLPVGRSAAQVFTLGVLLGEIATRAAPYAPWIHEVGTVEGDVRITEQFATGSPLRPHVLDNGVPAAFRAVVADCLQRSPTARPTTREVVSRLRQCV